MRNFINSSKVYIIDIIFVKLNNLEYINLDLKLNTQLLLYQILLSYMII